MFKEEFKEEELFRLTYKRHGNLHLWVVNDRKSRFVLVITAHVTNFVEEEIVDALDSGPLLHLRNLLRGWEEV